MECLPGSRPCADGLNCIADDLFCDGELNCQDGSDEDSNICGKVSLYFPLFFLFFSYRQTHILHKPQIFEIIEIAT